METNLIKCASEYLAVRYVHSENQQWAEGVRQQPVEHTYSTLIDVQTATDVERAMTKVIDETMSDDAGVMLSGGIDSAIVAAMLPRGTKAFTIDFVAETAVRESRLSRTYAEHLGLDLHVVDVDKETFFSHAEALMRHKKSPLHPIEPALYELAQQAREMGINKLYTGKGADTNFGGLDKLMSRDWTFDDFVTRYNFLNPQDVLQDGLDVGYLYEPYRDGENIDFMHFLRDVHGRCSVLVFENPISLAGVEMIEPFEHLNLVGGFDFERIRNGEPKYLLVELFTQLYQTDAPWKVPFSRPTEEWLQTWEGPAHELFRNDVDYSTFGGDPRFLMWSLNEFLTLLSTWQ